MRLTKVQMVKDIFFLATEGERTLDNYVSGMGIIEAVAGYNYRSFIQECWDKVNEAGDRATARKTMRTLATSTLYNLPVSNRQFFYADRRKFNF